MSKKLPLKETVLVLLAPILLVMTAGVQRYLVVTHNLDPWRGGGYGMFTDLALRRHRVVSVAVRVSEKSGHIRGVPASMEEFVDSLQLMPSQALVKDLLHRLLAEEWVRTDDERRQLYLKQDQPKDVACQPLPVKDITVTVWQYGFDADTMKLTRTPLVQVGGAADGG